MLARRDLSLGAPFAARLARSLPPPHGTAHNAAGEEISFDYELNEWDMATPFTCQCGNSNCRGYISGFKNATAANQEELLKKATPLILSTVAAAPAAAPAAAAAATA